MLNWEKKLDILAEAAQYDVCMSSCNGNDRNGRGRYLSDDGKRWIYPAHLPGQGPVGFLKILMSNKCINNCSYCLLASSRDRVERTDISPEELARLFMQFYRKRLAHGIFLSSGVDRNSVEPMCRMVECAKILRNRYRFTNYIHIKILPGTPESLIKEAALYANRLSLNMEAPKRELLKRVAPQKNMVTDIVGCMRSAQRAIENRRSMAASQTTQYVVGASGELDLDILKSADYLYREYHLYRSYFSAFQPLEGESDRHSFIREQRLYQADFLLRGYGFRLPDLVFDEEGFLPKEVDPKVAYALTHPDQYPIDVNRATEETLLKVPGIGPLSAARIVSLRKESPFRGTNELQKVGVRVKNAAPYLLFSGKKGDSFSKQGLLFEELKERCWRTGERPYNMESTQQAPKRYDYPGQRGKPLSYSRGSKRVYCR